MGKHTQKGKHESNRGGKFIPALCNLIGTVLILAVILILLPTTVPRLLGFEIYNVISGSMSPAIPQGSMILVRQMDWTEIRAGDVIAFMRDGLVISHRVVAVQPEERSFTTKGDANEIEDLAPVPFKELVGKVERHYPVLGEVATQLATNRGKLYLGALAVSGLLFRWMAERIAR